MTEEIFKMGIYCSQDTNFEYKDTKRLKIKGCKKLLYANSNQTRVEVAMLSSEKKTQILSQKKLQEIRHNMLIK